MTFLWALKKFQNLKLNFKYPASVYLLMVNLCLN